MAAFNYPNVGRTGRFCKGHYVICQFGYHYLACRPEDKPDDPLLKASLKEFLVSSTYGEQFLRNLHPWKNKENIIDQIFHYLAHDDYQHSTQSLAKSIKWIAHELFIGNLLIIPLSEPKEIYTSYTSYELAQLEQEKSKQTNTSIINSKLLNDEIKNATPKSKKSSQAQIKNSEQKAVVARKKSIQYSQIALAKSEGSSSDQIKARKLVALDYLQSNGFTEDQIFDALGSSDGTKDGGIDLTKPLEVISFPPPDTMTQFVASHGYPGNWFDPLSNQTPDSLGISGEGRTKKTFTVVKGTGLKSTAKPVVDVWTSPDKPVEVAGGGIQLLVNDKTKLAISAINPIGT